MPDQKIPKSLEEIEKKVTPILRRNNVEFAGVFGSRARGQAKKDSDVDIVIRFSIPKSLFDLVGLQQELTEELNLGVDLATEKYIHPYIKAQVQKDLKVIYGQRRYL